MNPTLDREIYNLHTSLKIVLGILVTAPFAPRLTSDMNWKYLSPTLCAPVSGALWARHSQQASYSSEQTVIA